MGNSGWKFWGVRWQFNLFVCDLLGDAKMKRACEKRMIYGKLAHTHGHKLQFRGSVRCAFVVCMLRNQDFESGVQIRRTPFNRIRWCVNFPCRFFHLTGSRLQNIKILFDLWFWFVYLSRSNYLSSARAILFINERLSTRPGPKCCPEQVPRTDWPQSSAGNLRVCVCVCGQSTRAMLVVLLVWKMKLHFQGKFCCTFR